MRLALLFTFFLLTRLLAAQSGLSFDTPFVEKPVDPAISDVKAQARVLNNDGRRLLVRWIREVNDVPAGWSSAICDTNQCYLPQVDSADFSISPNSSAPIEPHVYPDGSRGDAQITVRVFEIADRTNSATATFRFSEISGVSNPFYSGPRIYPNPGRGDFEVMSDVPISKITLTNVLGKVVREYPAYLKRYDISDLPNGIYLASLIGLDGRVIKTLRYSKRQVMP